MLVCDACGEILQDDIAGMCFAYMREIPDGATEFVNIFGETVQVKHHGTED